MVHTELSTGLHGKDPLETALNAVPLAILLIDSTLKIRWVNTRGEALLGRQRDLLIGQSIDTIQGGLWTWSHTLDFDKTLRALFPGGDSICGEEHRCTILVDGKKTEYDLTINASPIVFAGDQVLLMALEDITHLKKLEKENTETETLDLAIQMARATIHELNQPLSVLMGNLDLLIRKQEANGPLKDRIDRISKSADRVAGFVRRLQTIIRSPKKRYALKASPVNSGKASLTA